jgi:hypothetical protein
MILNEDLLVNEGVDYRVVARFPPSSCHALVLNGEDGDPRHLAVYEGGMVLQVGDVEDPIVSARRGLRVALPDDSRCRHTDAVTGVHYRRVRLIQNPPEAAQNQGRQYPLPYKGEAKPRQRVEQKIVSDLR